MFGPKVGFSARVKEKLTRHTNFTMTALDNKEHQFPLYHKLGITRIAAMSNQDCVPIMIYSTGETGDNYNVNCSSESRDSLKLNKLMIF